MENALITDAEHNLVYYVDCKEYQDPMNPLAIRPRITDNTIWWEDTGQWGSQVKFTSIEKELTSDGSGNKIVITAISGGKVTLLPLTVRIYNEKVRAHAAGSPEFVNDEELQEYYLSTAFYNY